MQRTDWAEVFLEQFTALPLTFECVFRSPKYLPENKELCDHLLILRDEAILVSLKCQDDPSRTGEKLLSWVQKSALKGLSQAKGAVRSVREKDFYCIHPRRGRVDFRPGTVRIRRLLVLVETFQVVSLPEELPLLVDGTPISYLSPNDFLNMVDQLRALPDLEGYLKDRQELPPAEQRIIGREKDLFEFYVVNDLSFAGWRGKADAVTVHEQNKDKFRHIMKRKRSADSYALLIEAVSDALATRHPDYLVGLDDQTATRFDNNEARRNYLDMQAELCDLRLGDRRLAGFRLGELIQKTASYSGPDPMTYAAIWCDSKPDFLYVMVASKGIERPELINRCTLLLRGGLAFYRKERGMVIADRDGANFEVQMIQGFQATEDKRKIGESFFGNLKITDYPSSLVP